MIQLREVFIQNIHFPPIARLSEENTAKYYHNSTKLNGNINIEEQDWSLFHTVGSTQLTLCMGVIFPSAEYSHFQWCKLSQVEQSLSVLNTVFEEIAFALHSELHWRYSVLAQQCSTGHWGFNWFENCGILSSWSFWSLIKSDKVTVTVGLN